MHFIHYLETISGITIYPLISLVVFVLFFIILFTMVLKMDKKGIEFLKNIPLSDNEQEDTIQSTKK